MRAFDVVVVVAVVVVEYDGGVEDNTDRCSTSLQRSFVQCTAHWKLA